jgi:dTMP kinase
MKKGIFIVIDGTDGTGKSTQVQAVVQHLENLGYPVKKADFPRYEEPSSFFIQKYLHGEYGTAKEVGSHRAAIFYALDRYDASFTLKKWLNEGMIIVSDRYVSASMGHQASHIKDAQERHQFIKWLYDLEYSILDIPKPDTNIILHAPIELAQKMIEQRADKKYLKGKKKDILESDLKHLRRASEAYLEIGNIFDEFHLVDCSQNTDELRPVEDITHEIMSHLYPLLEKYNES